MSKISPKIVVKSMKLLAKRGTRKCTISLHCLKMFEILYVNSTDKLEQ